ncbi:DNA glycosylase [Xylaria bambusicola]|uniref:DNA glycosylase n=1 Tax=Xylaria bambusicola TaxID=326684 RepID=UPI0020077FB8|nr:DNA glycosylase [Xylaria bambusicola]KAI0509115.1 DNA glycosylase [Xylaria bambusicola]
MSEEADEHNAITSKEPSFNGRLQLKNFMFSASASNPISSPITRRSPRLSSQAAAISSSSRSITPSSPTPLKRKSQSRNNTTTTTIPKNASEDDSASPSKKKAKRTRTSSSYAPPSTYAHLPPLTDVIAPNLLILFIGLNPGVQTARSGHAYAHPSNLFWKLLYSSGITPVPCKPEEDRTLPARFSLGNTNIVSRPSRNGAELSKAEMDAGVAVLEAKCRTWRPEAVCVVGKSIWESIFRVWKGRNLARGEFEYGWQVERMGAVPPARDSAAVKVGDAVLASRVKAEGDDEDRDEKEGDEENVEEGEERAESVDDGPWEGARVFVATSTSGLAATVRPEEKERIWKILGDWCVQRRKERAEVKTENADA